MGNWYRVTKKIHGRFYDYWQRTERHGKQVKTFNKYIGPTTTKATITGWQHMSAASRYNARMDRIFNNAIQAKKDQLALVEAKARFPSKDATPIEKQLADVEWQIYATLDRKEKTVMSHPDHKLLEQQIGGRVANENQRKVHYKSIQYVVKPEARGPRYEAVNRAFPVSKPSPIPTLAQANKMIAKEGGYVNISSLPAENAYAASQLAHSAALNEDHIYKEATKRGLRINNYLMRFDAATDSLKRFRIINEFMAAISDDPRPTVQERREDERIQYGNRKARLEKVQAEIRKAKRATAGIKKLNPFIAKGIKRSGPTH